VSHSFHFLSWTCHKTILQTNQLLYGPIARQGECCHTKGPTPHPSLQVLYDHLIVLFHHHCCNLTCLGQTKKQCTAVDIDLDLQAGKDVMNMNEEEKVGTA
jgi:hypothetical protein